MIGPFGLLTSIIGFDMPKFPMALSAPVQRFASVGCVSDVRTMLSDRNFDAQHEKSGGDGEDLCGENG